MQRQEQALFAGLRPLTFFCCTQEVKTNFSFCLSKDDMNLLQKLHYGAFYTLIKYEAKWIVADFETFTKPSQAY